MARKEEIKLKVSTDVANAKKNIQDLKKENQGLADSIGFMGFTWGAVKQQFAAAKNIMINGLTMLRNYAIMTGGAFKLLFSGQMIKSARTLFTVIKAGIAGTGIGLLLVAFGSLVAYFTSSEKGASKLKQIMNMIGVVFGNITDVAAELGEKIMWAFDNPKEAVLGLWDAIKQNIVMRVQGLIDTFKGLGKVIQAALDLDWDAVKKESKKVGESIVQTMTGVDDAIGKVKKSITGLKKDFQGFFSQSWTEMQKAAALEGRRLKILKDERDLQVQIAKDEKDINEARLKAREEDKYSLEERIGFLKNAGKIAKDQVTEELRIARLKLANQIEENSYSKSNTENLQKEADLEAEVFRLQAKNFNTRKRIENEIIALKREQAAKDKEAQTLKDQQDKEKKDKEKAQAEALRDLKWENELLMLEDAKEIALKELEIAEIKELEKLKIHENYEELKLEVEKKFQKKRQDLDKATIKWDDYTTDEKIKTLSLINKAMSQFAGDNKALAVSQAIIDTYTGATAALKGGTPLDIAQGGLIVATGLANVKKILETETPTTGGASGNTSPSVQQVNPNNRFVGGSFELQGGENEPMRAYVVTEDINQSQNKLEAIQNRAEI